MKIKPSDDGTIPVEPDDGYRYDPPLWGLATETGGDIRIETLGGSVVVLKDCIPYTVLPLFVVRVLEEHTTAEKIYGVPKLADTLTPTEEP